MPKKPTPPTPHPPTGSPMVDALLRPIVPKTQPGLRAAASRELEDAMRSFRRVAKEKGIDVDNLLP